jgi:hypothetical protein
MIMPSRYRAVGARGSQCWRLGVRQRSPGNASELIWLFAIARPISREVCAAFSAAIQMSYSDVTFNGSIYALAQ